MGEPRDGSGGGVGMNELIVRLFGVEGLRPGEEGVRFAFTHPLPAWAWALVVLVALVLAVWSYWRIEGRLGGRALLGAGRGLLLIALALLAAGPRMVRDNERVERDAVIVLLDRSASLRVPDAPGGATRDSQLRELLGQEVWQGLGEDHEIVWMGFDSGVYELVDAAPGEPVGARTRIGAALNEAVSRTSGRPLAGVVLVTDGRTNDAPNSDTVRRLSAQRVSVFSVPLGSAEPLLDIALARLDAPRSAFVGDFVPVNVRVSAHGGAVALPGARVVLEDSLTGAVLDETQIEPGGWTDGAAEVRLATRPLDAGSSRWVVRVESAGADVVSENNAEAFEIDLVDRPLRVAYFDGYPRWDYRYIKDLLVREQSIVSSVMLLATDRRYIQEGNVGLTNVPRSTGEWSEFDVIVLGDLRPDVMSQEQLEQIRSHVAERGGGLVWIAGPGSTPGAWFDTPLGDLIPFVSTMERGGQGFGAAPEPVTLRRESAAERLGVLEMGDEPGSGWYERLSRPETGWSVLRWAIAVEPPAVKPTAEVLASVVGVSPGAPAWPNILTMRYGAGRVVFVGTDEIWLWRYARGEALPERFYLPLIRLAGRGSLLRAGESVAIEVEPVSSPVETPVRIRAVLLDQSLVDVAAPALEVRVGLKGSPESERSRIRLGRESDGEGASSYATSWAPIEPGEYVVEAIDPLVASADARAEFRVLSPDDELRTPDADHALLADLARRTGGETVLPGEVSRLPELLPKRSIVIEGEPDIETLWDRPIVLAFLILLLTAEWVGRRLTRLA